MISCKPIGWCHKSLTHCVGPGPCLLPPAHALLSARLALLLVWLIALCPQSPLGRSSLSFELNQGLLLLLPQSSGFPLTPATHITPPTPEFLPGKSHGQRSLVGYSPWGCKRVRHDWAARQQQQRLERNFLASGERSMKMLTVEHSFEGTVKAFGQRLGNSKILPY